MLRYLETHSLKDPREAFEKWARRAHVPPRLLEALWTLLERHGEGLSHTTPLDYAGVRRWTGIQALIPPRLRRAGEVVAVVVPGDGTGAEWDPFATDGSLSDECERQEQDRLDELEREREADRRVRLSRRAQRQRAAAAEAEDKLDEENS
jgi:hypothetical protein